MTTHARGHLTRKEDWMNNEINRGNDGNPSMERVLAARRGLKSLTTRAERADRRIETAYLTEIIMRESAEFRQEADQEPEKE
jgi:hypothetical protein